MTWAILLSFDGVPWIVIALHFRLLWLSRIVSVLKQSYTRKTGEIVQWGHDKILIFFLTRKDEEIIAPMLAYLKKM